MGAGVVGNIGVVGSTGVGVGVGAVVSGKIGVVGVVGTLSAYTNAGCNILTCNATTNTKLIEPIIIFENLLPFTTSAFLLVLV